MTTGKALNGKPYAGNPHVAPSQCYGGTGRFDEGEVACTAEASLRRRPCRRQPEGCASRCAATPRRGSLLYKARTNGKLKTGFGLALFGAALPLFADYAVTAATSQTAPLALYTSAAETPTYAVAAGALATPFLVTYKEGETVSVTSPNGVTTQLSGTDGTISFNPTSGGVWKFANSNGSTAFVGKGWNGDGFASVSDEGALSWLETKSEGPDRTVKTEDTPSLAYSDASFTGDESGTVTLQLTDPAGTATVYTKEAGKEAEALRLNKSGVWTVVLTTPSGVSTAEITVRDVGFMLIVK